MDKVVLDTLLNFFERFFKLFVESAVLCLDICEYLFGLLQFVFELLHREGLLP